VFPRGELLDLLAAEVPGGVASLSQLWVLGRLAPNSMIEASLREGPARGFGGTLGQRPLVVMRSMNLCMSTMKRSWVPSPTGSCSSSAWTRKSSRRPSGDVAVPPFEASSSL